MLYILVIGLLYSRAIRPKREVVHVGWQHVGNFAPSLEFFYHNCRVNLALTVPYDMRIDLD